MVLLFTFKPLSTKINDEPISQYNKMVHALCSICLYRAYRKIEHKKLV